jgi:hypothetical protein
LVIMEWGLTNHLPRLTSNHNPPNLSLLSSQAWVTGTQWSLWILNVQLLTAINFPLISAFAVSQSFLYIVFPFSFDSRNFLFPSLILQ